VHILRVHLAPAELEVGSGAGVRNERHLEAEVGAGARGRIDACWPQGARAASAGAEAIAGAEPIRGRWARRAEGRRSPRAQAVGCRVDGVGNSAALGAVAAAAVPASADVRCGRAFCKRSRAVVEQLQGGLDAAGEELV
jgi:hypothetical protein